MSAHSLAPRGDVGYAASAQYVPIRLQTADELATARDFDAFYALRGALRDDRQQHRHNRGDFEQPPATCELAARVNMSPRHMRRGLAALREHGKTLRTHDEHGRERLTIPDAVDNKDMRSQWTRCPDPAFLTLRHDRHLKRTFTAYIQSAWNERHDPRKAGKATEATVETIAAKIRRSPRTVQRHTAELEALGLLVREYRPGQPHLTRLLEPWNELAARPLLRPVPAPECGQECHPPSP